MERAAERGEGVEGRGGENSLVWLNRGAVAKAGGAGEDLEIKGEVANRNRRTR